MSVRDKVQSLYEIICTSDAWHQATSAKWLKALLMVQAPRQGATTCDFPCYGPDGAKAGEASVSSCRESIVGG